MKRFYSLRRCRRILRQGYSLFVRKKDKLSSHDKSSFETELKDLDAAILKKDRQASTHHAEKVALLTKKHFPKTAWDHTREIVFALVFAIVIAFLIRQFWFELYEVPTGSMRPTIKELDRMVVSKTPFGIHFPFWKRPFLFSTDDIKRAGIVVFTVEGMDVADSDMLYFRIFPGKKRFIKRGIAKPGDIIYFYGGRIYGIDRDGNPITELSDEKWLKEIGIEKIDHIPYISMDGKARLSMPFSHGVYGSTLLNQMNLPVGKLEMQNDGKIEGTFFNGIEWVKDNPATLKEKHETPQSYSDLWGIGNYAMARLLTPEEANAFYKTTPSNEEILYLELHHTPNLSYPPPEIRQDEFGKFHPMITPYSALIPLNQDHLNAIQRALFTSRFYIQDGHAYRYHEEKFRPQRPEFDPRFSGVPNGCYEFYYGVGYQVHFGGFRTKLPKDHPLYRPTSDNIRKLFNLGIAFNRLFDPVRANQPFLPQRFAYYREGDLYLMGAPIIKKDDPVLVQFVQEQIEKQNDSTDQKPYIAFVDRGPPLKDGKIDAEFIRSFGLEVPDTGLVALGDNYAMSADSRDFGFVPIENLRGAPSFTFWPPGNRLGCLPQPPYPWITLPNLIIWGLVILITLFTLLYLRNRNKRSIFKP